MEYKLNLPPDYIPRPLPGRDEWLTELRSEKYKQGKTRLCQNFAGVPRYCCLGVLCTLQKRPQVEEGYSLLFDGWGGVLANENPVHRQLNDSGEFPMLVWVTVYKDGAPAQLKNLADCNDQGLTFSQIADIIEKIWKHEPKNWQ